jgi:hypothetical protein
MAAMLVILRLTRNPLVVPRLAERTLASLSALGVAPAEMAVAYRTTLQALFALILSGPGRAYLAPKDRDEAERLSPLGAEGAELAHVSRFRKDVLDDLLQSTSWRPDPQVTRGAVRRLIQELGVG